ncbi:hypothetical protein CANCADRAFT_14512, partial [Tortispora caseinolytica NRRL Y-17796]
DAYVVLYIATTCDDQGIHTTKEKMEIIELAWSICDANTIDTWTTGSARIKPQTSSVNSMCTSLTNLTYDDLKDAGSLDDALELLHTDIETCVLAHKKSFAFVTFNAWDIRVQLIKDAFVKGTLLKQYLRHPKVFDLRSECGHWSLRHPSAPIQSPNSLQNIYSILDISGDSTDDIARLALKPTRSGDEEILLITQALRSLKRKSAPAEEYPEVLTMPLDSWADLCAFMSEQSRVLFLSNLPIETTQSELEQFFAHYKVKPQAYWTLRTPDHLRSSGTGIVVFETHEDASHCLTLNGRSINEQPVEVSASSNTILERARDILTSFPVNKNRPRPGDWNCPMCGFSNFQRRAYCFRCSSPSPAAAFTGNYHHQHQHQHGYNHGTGTQQHRHNGGASNAVPFRAGDWKCGTEGCGYHNFAKNVSCLRCGASRASAAIVADSTSVDSLNSQAG